MAEHAEQPPRRTFLKFVIHSLGALFTVLLGAPVIAYLIDGRNRPKPPGDKRVVHGVRLSELEEGKPVQGVLRDVRHDAWTLHPNDVIGRVWVLKTGPGAVSKEANNLTVFTTVCPHLGCSINYTGSGFLCPCHQGRFDAQGHAVRALGTINPAPRDMDTLDDWEVAGPTGDVLLVKYQTFKTAQAAKEVRA